jgi:hypothetical protein
MDAMEVDQSAHIDKQRPSQSVTLNSTRVAGQLDMSTAQIEGTRIATTVQT